MTSKEKYKKMITKKGEANEGFGPVYYKGKIAPGYEGLEPKEQKNAPIRPVPREKYKQEIKKKQQPWIKNIKHLA